MGADGEVKCFLSELSWGEVSISALQDRRISFVLQGQVHLSRLFSVKEASGIRVRIVIKYIMDAICPIIMKGWFTGWPPIQVRFSRIVIRNQYRN